MYLQNVEGGIGDAQVVKDVDHVPPTPDFAGTLVASLRQQALALLDPATAQTKTHSDKIWLVSWFQGVASLTWSDCSRSPSEVRACLAGCCFWPCFRAHPWTTAGCHSSRWSWRSLVHSPQCCGLHPAPGSGLTGWCPSREDRECGITCNVPLIPPSLPNSRSLWSLGPADSCRGRRRWQLPA